MSTRHLSPLLGRTVGSVRHIAILLTLALPFMSSLNSRTARADERVYQEAVRSTVWIVTDSAFGTGAVVNWEGKKVIVTAYHVVENAANVVGFFAAFDDEHELITNPAVYLDSANRKAIGLKLVSANPECDLAVLESDKIPDTAPGLPLAHRVQVGSQIHVVGNSSSSPLFGYMTGTVRGVFGSNTKPGSRSLTSLQSAMGFQPPPITGAYFTSDAPVNHGDSGGPALHRNENGELELVGLTQSYTNNARSVSNFIHAKEILSLLKHPQVPPASKQTPDADSPERPRDHKYEFRNKRELDWSKRSRDQQTSEREPSAGPQRTVDSRNFSTAGSDPGMNNRFVGAGRCLNLAWFPVYTRVMERPLEFTASTPTNDQAKGSLVIIGGSERFQDNEIWDTIVTLAGGHGSRIAIFPTAVSGDPFVSCEKAVQTFRRAGAEAFVVPVAWQGIDRDIRDAVNDLALVEKVRSASGVYFVGGSQGRIVDALRDTTGHPTPMLNAVWDIYQRGGVIAGTSAGAAIMSQIMYRDPPNSLEILQRGVSLGKELDHGLGFLDSQWYVEQHCLVRGRFARALVAMCAQRIPFGVGIDENTALVVEHGWDARVIGYKGVLMLDASRAIHDFKSEGFCLNGVKLSYLDRGDRINLRTREVTPADEKLAGQARHPSEEAFQPYFDIRPVRMTGLKYETEVAARTASSSLK